MRKTIDLLFVMTTILLMSSCVREPEILEIDIANANIDDYFVIECTYEITDQVFEMHMNIVPRENVLEWDHLDMKLTFGIHWMINDSTSTQGTELTTFRDTFSANDPSSGFYFVSVGKIDSVNPSENKIGESAVWQGMMTVEANRNWIGK